MNIEIIIIINFFLFHTWIFFILFLIILIKAIILL